MKLMINGEYEEHRCETVAALLKTLGHQPESVATAVNGEFVSIAERDLHHLVPHDAIEVIAPMAGG